MTNGKPLNWRAATLCLTLAGLVFSGGGQWYKLSAQEPKITKNEELSRKNELALVGMARDIAHVRETMDLVLKELKQINGR